MLPIFQSHVHAWEVNFNVVDTVVLYNYKLPSGTVRTYIRCDNEMLKVAPVQTKL